MGKYHRDKTRPGCNKKARKNLSVSIVFVKENASSSIQNISDITCYSWGSKGHFKYECEVKLDHNKRHSSKIEFKQHKTKQVKTFNNRHVINFPFSQTLNELLNKLAN